MPKWKCPPDPWSDLELELVQLTTLSQMIVELDARSQSERVDYLTERLPEHLGRANKAFRDMLAAKPAPAPAGPRELSEAPLSAEEKKALIKSIERM